ncbi:Crp/Fnr family transcriptional regulator [Sphingomonas sp. CFBP 8760]|uniref:Crp/Fnr family transcriptional regulator n=1 Tax=Sphingomonas sp. CFBP 8760 TaxID=2775282 RepID=UPI0017810BE5|nr:Crp/Fnr family transcriptional regulator [Sphingomonas sp. CFBP 8760]MBD8546765.1 Crp/Fnr family transcriptional regulator [Sphingomonas sp. CFBP 8760]
MNDHPLITRLQYGCRLDDRERQALRDLCTDVRDVARGVNIVRDGEKADHVNLIMSGWAARYKVLPDGARQITALLLPGDLCDLRCTMLARIDQGITALTPTRVAYIVPQAINQLEHTSAQIGHAMAWCSLVEHATLRAWIVNMGRRRAVERVAHLLSELAERMAMVAPNGMASHFVPLTQEEIADALGLTPVHVNRVAQELRGQAVISSKRGGFTILDLPALQAMGGFNGGYLNPHMIPAAA